MLLVMITLLLLGICTAEKEQQNLKYKPGCTLCMKAAQTVGMFLQSQKGTNTIDSAIDYICPNLPIEDKCRKVFREVHSFLVELSGSINPWGACEIINMCQKPPKFETEVPTCKQCQATAQDALASLELPVIRSSVTSMLQGACDTIRDKSTKKACTEFFDREFQNGLHAMADNLERRAVCELAGYCQLSGAHLVNQPLYVCNLCERSVDSVQNFVESSEFQGNVKQIVQTACKLTGNYAEKCYDGVIEVLTKLVQEITHDSSEHVCEKWHLCSKN